jgi:predicted  nucleic acid-binding Zn-ribbon protein
MTSAISGEALRELHRIHRQLTDLRDRLARGPKQVKAAELNLARCEQQLTESKQGLTKARMASDERQLQLKTREDRILDLQGKLNSASTNKEYQALKEQIAADDQANSVLSDEILEMLEKIDELQANVSNAEELLAKAKSETEKVTTRVNDEQVKLKSELERVTGELHAAEAGLPSEFKSDYERISKVRGEDALAQIDGEVCSSCYQTITSQMMNELFMSRPVFCKSCGALLYLPEDRTI